MIVINSGEEIVQVFDMIPLPSCSHIQCTHGFTIYTFKCLNSSPARVVRWLDHLDAMCSREWCALCAVGSRFNSSRGPGKAS